MTIILTTVSAWTGCISDCKSKYESEVDDCHLIHGNDPEDADDRQMCLEDAKDTYDPRKDGCQSWDRRQ